MPIYRHSNNHTKPILNQFVTSHLYRHIQIMKHFLQQDTLAVIIFIHKSPHLFSLYHKTQEYQFSNWAFKTFLSFPAAVQTDGGTNRSNGAAGKYHISYFPAAPSLFFRRSLPPSCCRLRRKNKDGAAVCSAVCLNCRRKG